MPRNDVDDHGRTRRNTSGRIRQKGPLDRPLLPCAPCRMTDHRDYLTLAEVADLIGVHPVTIRRRIAAGLIPGYKVGNQVRIRRADVDLLLRRIPVAP